MSIKKSPLQNSGWMSGNPTLRLFSGWNELHGGSMERNSSSGIGQRGEADRRSRVLQLAQNVRMHAGWLLVSASLVLCVSAYADETGHDIAAGKKIFAYGLDDRIPACQKCHGANGLGLGAFDIGTPRTASQVYTYLLKQLTDFATNRRTDTIMHQMNRIAKGLSAQQRKDMAAYLHALKWPYKGSDLKRLAKDGVQVGDPARGARVFRAGIPAQSVAACQVCHGYDGQSAGKLYPLLSGQNYLYLTHELKSFRLAAQGVKKNARSNDFMGQMRAVAGKLTDRDINDVAAFLTGATPPPAPNYPGDAFNE